jgi:ABC-type glycerol-3-phosphate transport system permease component
MGIGSRVLVAIAYTIARLEASLENSVVMIAKAGVRLLASIAPLFIQLRQNGIVNIYQAAVVPDVVFALSLTFVILSFATVYTVDYAAQTTAALAVTMPLVVLGLIFRRGVVSALTAGTVEG